MMLKEVLPAPIQPKEIPRHEYWGSSSWRWIGITGDYKKFIEEYGTGVIDEFIWIFNPVSSNPNLNLCVQIERQADVLCDLKRHESGDVVPVFPRMNGIIPVGVTDNGDVLVLEHQKNDCGMTVGVVGARSSTLISYNVGLIEFLSGVLRGGIRCSEFPDDFPSEFPKFRIGDG